MASDRSEIAHRVTQLMVLLSCLATGGGATLLLLQDLSDVAGARTGRHVGEVREVLGTVRQRTSSSLMWRILGLGQGLYLRDSIQVGQESFASLKLDNGNVLDIGENSLVVLDEVTGLDFQILRGSMVVRNADGEQSVEAQGKNPPKIKKFPFQLVEPTAYRKFFVGSAAGLLAPVSFLWKGIGANQSVVEISRSRKFGSIVASAPATNDGESIKIPAESGVYYWRIASEGVAFSTFRAFEIVKVAPLEALFPLDGQKVGVDAAGTRFTWTAPSTLSGVVERGEHTLEIFKSSELSPWKRVPLAWDKNETFVADLPVGSLRWRIASRYDKIVEYSGMHHIETFSLSRLPASVATEDLFLKITRSPGEHRLSLDGPTTLSFEWQAQSKENEYQIVFAKDPEFRSVVLVEKVSSPTFQLKDSALSQGNTYWRVSVIDKEGREKLSSRPQKIKVTLPDPPRPPTALSPRGGEQVVGSRAKSIRFKWNRTPGVTQYSVFVKTGGEIVARGKTEQDTWTATDLKPGTYTWTLECEDRFGRKCEKSKELAFTVNYGPRLRAPAFDVPGGGR